MYLPRGPRPQPRTRGVASSPSHHSAPHPQAPGAEAQRKDSQDLRPLVSPQARAKGTPRPGINAAEKAGPPERRWPRPAGPCTPSGLPGKARGLIVDVHNVHLERCGGFEPSAISHSRDEMETVRETARVREWRVADTTSKGGGESWGGGREESALSGHPPSATPVESELPCLPFLPRPYKPTPSFSLAPWLYSRPPSPHGCPRPPCCTPYLCVVPHDIPANVY